MCKSHWGGSICCFNFNDSKFLCIAGADATDADADADDNAADDDDSDVDADADVAGVIDDSSIGKTTCLENLWLRRCIFKYTYIYMWKAFLWAFIHENLFFRYSCFFSWKYIHHYNECTYQQRTKCSAYLLPTPFFLMRRGK